MLNHQDLFELSDAQINLAYDTIENDYKLLKEDEDDSTIKKNIASIDKELNQNNSNKNIPIVSEI